MAAREIERFPARNDELTTTPPSLSTRTRSPFRHGRHSQRRRDEANGDLAGERREALAAPPRSVASCRQPLTPTQYGRLP